MQTSFHKTPHWEEERWGSGQLAHYFFGKLRFRTADEKIVSFCGTYEAEVQSTLG